MATTTTGTLDGDKFTANIERVAPGKFEGTVSQVLDDGRKRWVFHAVLGSSGVLCFNGKVPCDPIAAALDELARGMEASA